jgi:peptidoglycan/xylan/chitin deacetylase (PgdA/CDA1 family)
MRTETKDRVVSALVALGLDRLCARYYGGRGIILTFHRLVPRLPETPRLHIDAMEITQAYFQRVVEQVRRQYRVISLDELPDYLASSDRRPFACITFDDGYLDNFTLAYPVLKALDLPFTLFLATSFPDKTASLWYYALEDLLLQNDEVSFTVGGRARRFAARSRTEKLDAYERIWELIFDAPVEDYPAWWAALFVPAGLDVGGYVRALAMDWTQAAELSRDPRVSLGAHSVSHYPLRRLSDDQLEYEVAESRRIIQSRTGRAVDHFCYPFGSPAAAGPREFAVVKAAGFRTATTTRRGAVFNAHRDHLHALPRFDLGRTRPDLSFFRSQVSGLRMLFNREPRVAAV